MWKLADRPGRFTCVERPLIRYRIHEGATTKACIEDHRRTADETAMYGKIWPKPGGEGSDAFLPESLFSLRESITA